MLSFVLTHKAYKASGHFQENSIFSLEFEKLLNEPSS